MVNSEGAYGLRSRVNLITYAAEMLPGAGMHGPQINPLVVRTTLNSLASASPLNDAFVEVIHPVSANTAATISTGYLRVRMRFCLTFEISHGRLGPLAVGTGWAPGTFLGKAIEDKPTRAMF